MCEQKLLPIFYNLIVENSFCIQINGIVDLNVVQFS